MWLARLAALGTIVAAAACRTPPPRAPTTGAIAGDVRDRATGAPVAVTLIARGGLAEVETASSAVDGAYTLGGLPPGTYELVVVQGGAILRLDGIPVSAGRTTGLDLPIELAGVDVDRDVPMTAYAAVVGHRDPWVYPLAAVSAGRGQIEGTVTDTVTRERVAGAVITAAVPTAVDAVHAVTDDRGRFVFPDLPAGTYDLSAYYQVARRGQIEVRRNGITATAGHAVVVPVFIELSGTE
jgi:hypothetical protein